jgi:hypothetical protein
MISNVLREAVDAIRGSERPTTVPGFLRPVDTAAIARQLHLEPTAKKRGRSDIPPSDASTLDAIEQQIVQKIESEWTWQGGELINNLRAYKQRLASYGVQSEFTRLVVRAKDTLAQLREADHRAEAQLGPLREDYLAARQELQDFKTKNRLKRSAQVPSRRWTTFGFLFVLVAFESVANGIFFAKGSEFGLLGGVGTAIVISIVNIAWCFVLGLWPIRWINHCNFSVKLLGFLLSIAGIAGLVALHAFAGHYRDSMAAIGEDRALNDAIATLRATPWVLANLNSYYLFAMGLFFGILSIYKGATFDDPYPGYGPRSRRHEEIREEYSDEHADQLDGLALIKDETIELLDQGITKLPLYPQEAANIRAQRAALVQTFRGYEPSVETAANQLLSQYRDVNRTNRKTPAPAYFDRHWSLPHSFLDTAEVRTLTADQDEERIDMQSILVELKGLSQEVLDEYEKLMRTYPHPTRMELTDA